MWPHWTQSRIPLSPPLLPHDVVTMEQEDEVSYIDYEAFLDPTFSATSFANTLVLATNNASDTPLDLSTPLSRVLFDMQEIDTHIDTLTTKSAGPLLEHTQQQAESSGRILQQVEGQVASLTEAYTTLATEVIERHAVAEQVQLAAERLCETVKLGRAVARCLMLARQLEVRMSELGGVGSAKKEDHRAMVRSAETVLLLRQLLSASRAGEEGEGLDKVNVVHTLRTELLQPGERSIASRAQQVVQEFSLSALLSSATPTAASTFAQGEEAKARTTCALLTLFLLSPVVGTKRASSEAFEPTLMVNAVHDYLQTQVKASLTALGRALGQLPTLERALLDMSARCQNIAALQSLLEATRAPAHALLGAGSRGSLVQAVLSALDTSLLPSYFWRSLAQNLAPKVQELMQRGGVSARALRSNRDRVRDMVSECVHRGSQTPRAAGSRGTKGSSKGSESSSWEREAAVMVGSIMGQIK